MLQNPETTDLINNVINTYHLQLGVEQDPLQYPTRRTYTDSAWIQEFNNAQVTFNVTIHQNISMSLTGNQVKTKA